MGRQRDLVAAGSLARHALITWLRDAVDAAGLSDSQLARDTGYHRTTICRALSGRGTPTWPVMKLLATRCGRSVATARQLAQDAGVDCRPDIQVGIGGHPPADLASYPEFRRALQALLTWAGVSQREVIRRGQVGVLSRSMLGAVLRGERSASREVTIAITRACDASEVAVAAWADVWDCVGRPHREKMEKERRRIARARLRW